MRISVGFVVVLGLVLSFCAYAVEVEGFDNGPPCTGGGLLWDATCSQGLYTQTVWSIGRASVPIAPDDCYGRATYSGGNYGQSVAGDGFPVSTSTSYTISFYARHRPDVTWAGGTTGICWFEVDYAWGDHDSVWVRDVGTGLTVVRKWIETDAFSQTWAQYSNNTAENSGSNTFITLALKAGTDPQGGDRSAIPHIDHLDLEPIVSVYDWSVY